MSTQKHWRFIAGKAVGTSHIASGTPCQDAYACEVIRDVEGDDVLVVVVADGAGSAPLSHFGAELTSRAVVAAVREHLANATVGAFQRAVAEQIVQQVRSQLTAMATEASRPIRDYACTLVAAIIAPSITAFFQIGDGVIVVAPASEADNFSWVFWPERGEYANMTAFITDERWDEHLQYELGPGTVDEVAVLTDGLQNLVLDMRGRAAHSPFFNKMLAPLRLTDVEGNSIELSHFLERYLDSPRVNERTDDDKTLVLGSRRSP